MAAMGSPMERTQRAVTTRRQVVRAALAAPAAAAAAACGVGAPREEAGVQRGSKVARLVWYATGPQSRQDLHKKQTGRFKEIAGHEVEVVNPTGNYMDKLVADLSAGTQVDLFRLESGFLPGLVTRNQLVALDTYIKRDRLDLPDFYEKGVIMYQFQNKQWSLPWLAFRVLFANTQLLQQQGVPLPTQDWKNRSWNWQAFQTAVRRFVNPSSPAEPGGTWAFSSPQAFLDAWTWVLTAGGDVFSQDERAFTLDKPEAIEGLQFYADLHAKDQAHPKPSQLSKDPGEPAFLAGRVAFFYGAVAAAGRLAQAGFKAVAVPVPWGKAATATTGGGHSWPMNNASREKDATWELQKFLASRENDLLQVESGEAPPFRKSTAQLPQWKNRRPPENPDTMAESATYLRPQPKVPTWSEINAELDKALKPVWEGERSPREAVQAVKPTIDQLLERGWRDVKS
jgi:multiple sugar transport system substrate-binding protein